MTKRTMKPILIITIILCLLTSVPAVFAEGGDGSGNGQNQNIPFALDKTSIDDGEENVSLTPTIQLDFNKNICNIAVLPNNKKCFHLSDESGRPVAIQLIFPDDQVQQTYKRQVFIKPEAPLKPNTGYRIAIDRVLTAKNGMAIDNAYTLHFTTGTQAVQEKNVILTQLGENSLTYESALSETADSAPVDKQSLDADRQDQGLETATIAKIAAAVILFILIAFSAMLAIKRKRK